MNIYKLLLPLSIVTAVLTAWVYIDIIYFWSISYITIPLAMIFAIVTFVLALMKKNYLYAFINIILAIIVFAVFILFP